MLLLIRHTTPLTIPTPVSTNDADNAVALPWAQRPYLHLDTTGWQPLGQILAQHGIDVRRVYEIADANGIPDPRLVPLGLPLIIPK